ncbi:MAG: zinc ABC transporter substrate-binding protein [Synergistaceae bacterium]|nr:zinc ABC transporter substrate-binding protein [Synergistaceae bacterium]
MKLKTLFILAVSFTLTTSQAYAGLKISCSLFPVYDFTRAITQNLAEVSMILRPGTEPHEFEPSPRDIMTLNDSDVFVFTGRQMEHWADRISGTLSRTRIIDASEGIALVNNDPHIWLDLSLAQKMIRNICEGLCSAAPDNAQTFTHNAEEYCSRLAELDSQFMTLPKDKALVFAGEFSCGYFVRRYGLKYVSAYDGENEPGIKRMAEIMKHIRGNHTRYILSDVPVTRITQSISGQTGAEILTFSTAHNVQDTSRTFLEIMAENLADTARALHD